jgi:hypothetical protein
VRRLLWLLPLVSCSVYDESLLAPGFDPATCRWGECWWSESVAGCKTAGQPGADERPSASPADDAPILVALRQLFVGETLPPGAAPELQPWQALGFDLDATCTNAPGCAGATPSCASPSGAHADGALCRDNALAEILPAASGTELGTVHGVSEDKLNCGLYAGKFTLLFKITGYGGSGDDTNVRVDVYPALDVAFDGEPLPYDCDIPNWQGQITWDANYQWKLDASALENAAAGADSPSKINDPAAYVKSGYLVARFLDPTTFGLPGEASIYHGLSLTLYKGVLAGRLARDAQGLWTIEDGVLAGRMRRDDLIASVRGAGFCDTTAPGAYDAFVQSVDSALDVLSNGSNAEAAPCDALSVGIGFTAAQAAAGDAVTFTPPPECSTN